MCHFDIKPPLKSGLFVHFRALAQKLKMYGRLRFRNNVKLKYGGFDYETRKI